MNVLGKTMIFKSNYGYSCAISNKNQNGEYEKMYVAIQMPRGMDLENKTIIDIQKGFLTFYKTKEGLPKLKIVVMECEIINNTQTQEQTDLDLPF